MIDLLLLCCPYPDHGDLLQNDNRDVECACCGHLFKAVEGRPILLDENKSIFSSKDIAYGGDTRQFPLSAGWRYRLRQMLPAATSREVSLKLLQKYEVLLGPKPTILVLGCGFTGAQYAALFAAGNVILTDVTLHGDAGLVCDGECLPFRDQSLDCVVVDQVLEHALNPLAVVSEIHRCLKLGGIVYSGIPFLTPVHGFPFDFQRYTPLGHRMLFRRFQELELHVTQGPFSTISKTLIECLASFSNNVFWKRLSSAGMRLIIGPFLWIDKRFTFARGFSVPAATAFLGRKQAVEESLSSLISSWSISR